MYCRNCSQDLPKNARACSGCGLAPLNASNFCNNCGATTNPAAIQCIACSKPLPTNGAAVASRGGVSRSTAGIFAIFLGALGVHKFLMGYPKEGFVMLFTSLAVSWVTGGASVGVMALIGLIEGILYFTKSDADFANTYFLHRKGWF